MADEKLTEQDGYTFEIQFEEKQYEVDFLSEIYDIDLGEGFVIGGKQPVPIGNPLSFNLAHTRWGADISEEIGWIQMDLDEYFEIQRIELNGKSGESSEDDSPVAVGLIEESAGMELPGLEEDPIEWPDETIGRAYLGEKNEGIRHSNHGEDLMVVMINHREEEFVGNVMIQGWVKEE